MKDVLKLALEALQLVSIEFVCNGAHHAKKDRHDWLEPCPVVERYQAAITAIKEALAKDEKWTTNDMAYRPNGLSQPEQEPVAWVFTPNNDLLWPAEVEATNPIELNSYQPLYTTPPKHPWGEPDADEIVRSKNT